MAVQRLTAAYRSRPRPSSPPGAKASAICSYYLDGEPARVLHKHTCGVFHLTRWPWVQFSSFAEVGRR